MRHTPRGPSVQRPTMEPIAKRPAPMKHRFVLQRDGGAVAKPNTHTTARWAARPNTESGKLQAFSKPKPCRTPKPAQCGLLAFRPTSSEPAWVLEKQRGDSPRRRRALRTGSTWPNQADQRPSQPDPCPADHKPHYRLRSERRRHTPSSDRIDRGRTGSQRAAYIGHTSGRKGRRTRNRHTFSTSAQRWAPVHSAGRRVQSPAGAPTHSARKAGRMKSQGQGRRPRTPWVGRSRPPRPSSCCPRSRGRRTLPAAPAARSCHHPANPAFH